jgi:drug/metabolite transporter (DMT)-like permease
MGMVPAVFALIAALVYGGSDFVGGLLGRRMPTMKLLFWSQSIGLLFATLTATVFGAEEVGFADLAWGAVGGVAGTFGLYFLYKGLAEGRMAVVSPVAALVGALVPVGIGLGLGERPIPIEWIGIFLALPAIWLVAGAGDGEGTRFVPTGGLGFGVMAGLGFGLFFAALAQTEDGSGFWPLASARICQVAVLTLMIARTAMIGPKGFDQKGFDLPPVGSRWAIVGLGVGDMLANVFVLLAFRSGLLTLVGVLISLYPAVTVLLAVWVLSEPIGRRQRVGLGMALLAVALIAV